VVSVLVIGGWKYEYSDRGESRAERTAFAAHQNVSKRLAIAFSRGGGRRRTRTQIVLVLAGELATVRARYCDSFGFTSLDCLRSRHEREMKLMLRGGGAGVGGVRRLSLFDGFSSSFRGFRLSFRSLALSALLTLN
jgi:hypothetical protein